MPSHPGFWYRNGREMFFACQRSFGYGLVSSEVSHLIATLVKRLWLSYTTGLHIPATRWIGILPKESPDRCGTCAIYRTATAACLFTTSGSVVLVYPYSEKSVKIFSPLQRVMDSADGQQVVAGVTAFNPA